MIARRRFLGLAVLLASWWPTPTPWRPAPTATPTAAATATATPRAGQRSNAVTFVVTG